MFDAVLDDFKKRYAHKPVMISEFGSAPGEPGTRAKWIREAHRNLIARPHVKAVVWFNYDKRREKEPNWRIDADAQSLRAFNETFAAEPRPVP